jgi:hypothetical protein
MKVLAISQVFAEAHPEWQTVPVPRRIVRMFKHRIDHVGEDFPGQRKGCLGYLFCRPGTQAEQLYDNYIEELARRGLEVDRQVKLQ